MNPKDDFLTQETAKILKAISHPTRLWMVEQLAQGELCVCVFNENLESDFSTISKHLTVLKEAGLVDFEKRGKQVFYYLKMTCVLNFIACIKGTVKQEYLDKLKKIENHEAA
ncbi:MAG: helix-turn-helix transcriptional regulator [Candidatus Marinimicrobia bacterium]|nr:helix-turn-helix transcriptional regulator [Candidatus Neomarinimicrobiota bacterium]